MTKIHYGRTKALCHQLGDIETTRNQQNVTCKRCIMQMKTTELPLPKRSAVFFLGMGIGLFGVWLWGGISPQTVTTTTVLVGALAATTMSILVDIRK